MKTSGRKQASLLKLMIWLKIDLSHFISLTSRLVFCIVHIIYCFGVDPVSCTFNNFRYIYHLKRKSFFSMEFPQQYAAKSAEHTPLRRFLQPLLFFLYCWCLCYLPLRVTTACNVSIYIVDWEGLDVSAINELTHRQLLPRTHQDCTQNGEFDT